MDELARNMSNLSFKSTVKNTSYANTINPAEQKLFNTFVSSLDKEMKDLIANDPEYRDRQYLSTTPIVNLMDNDRLAKEFEADCFDKLSRDKQCTPGMREASVKQYKLLMPRLLENYNASVVGHRRN
jgi:hypothetical protein